MAPPLQRTFSQPPPQKFCLAPRLIRVTSVAIKTGDKFFIIHKYLENHTAHQMQRLTIRRYKRKIKIFSKLIAVRRKTNVSHHCSWELTLRILKKVYPPI